MLKPIVFNKPRTVDGAFYQGGEVAGFKPELADALIADGTARAAEPSEQSPAPPEPPKDDVIGTAAGFPFKNSDERQAARKGKR